MASATPVLRLPSQPQSITAPWPVPNYTAWWQRHMGVNNLPRVAARQCTGRESNRRPIDHESNAPATTLPSHPMDGRTKCQMVLSEVVSALYDCHTKCRVCVGCLGVVWRWFYPFISRATPSTNCLTHWCCYMTVTVSTMDLPPRRSTSSRPQVCFHWDVVYVALYCDGHKPWCPQPWYPQTTAPTNHDHDSHSNENVKH